MSFLGFGRKSTTDKLAAQVEPLTERVTDAGYKVSDAVKDAVVVARTWAEPRAKEAADQIQPLAREVYDKANLAAHDAYEKALPYVKDAYDKANIAAQEAAVKARPYIDDVSRRAEDTAEIVREDYLPRAKRAANAALDEARTGTGDLQTRAKGVVEASRKELEKPTKKSRGRKWLGFIAVAAAGAGAAYVAWARSKPVQDPWAEAYWEDVSTPVENELADPKEDTAPSESESATGLDEHEAAKAAGLTSEDN